MQVLEHEPVPLTRLRNPEGRATMAACASPSGRSGRGAAFRSTASPRERDHIAWFGAQQLTGLAMAHPAYHRILGQLLTEP